MQAGALRLQEQIFVLGVLTSTPQRPAQPGEQVLNWPLSTPHLLTGIGQRNTSQAALVCKSQMAFDLSPKARREEAQLRKSSHGPTHHVGFEGYLPLPRLITAISFAIFIAFVPLFGEFTHFFQNSSIEFGTDTEARFPF